MSPWMFILLSVVSIIIADILIGLRKKYFNRIEIPWGELLKRVFSWYVMLPAILSTLIASAILESVYLLAVPNLLLAATAYFRPIAQQPKETEETSENTVTWDEFIKAFRTVTEVSKNEKSINLFHMAIAAALIAMLRNRDDDTRN